MWEEHKRNQEPDLHLTVQDDERRFASFIENAKVADARNDAEVEPVHGLTKFSSLTQAEFEKLLLLDNVAEPSPNLAHAVDSPLYAPASDGGLRQDWSGTLAAPVRDQKDCASGWAFAAASQVASDAQRVLGVRYSLSPQQLLACDAHSDYCRGGWPEAAYAYVTRAGGLERESSYPYASSEGAQPSCRAATDDFAVSLGEVSPSLLARATGTETEMAMAYHVNSTGPLAVCVDATKWGSYVGGVLRTCGGIVNHCLQVVGLHTDDTGGGWWRLRNSWGSDWGEGGHIRLAFGQHTCALTTRPTFTTPSRMGTTARQSRDAD